MYFHPALGRLLAQAKLEEAQSRMPPAHVLRTASLERQGGAAVTRLSATSEDRREPPMPARKPRRFARRASQHADTANPPRPLAVQKLGGRRHGSGRT